MLILAACTAAGAAGYAFSRSGNATPAAGGASTGTGTVVGGTRSASPSPAPDGPAGRPPGQPPGQPAGRRAVEGRFSISGHVADLVPGVPATLPLTITNPNPWPIRVLSVDVSVGTPSSGACPASTLRVAPFSGAALASPRGTVSIEVPVELVDSRTHDQSGCPRATFPLSFTGTAERVAGR